MTCTNGGIWWPILCPGSQLFLSNDTFAAPNFVKLVRVLIVGGGGSGCGGDGGGGGGGYVACGNITLNNGTTVSVIVGAGGNQPSGGVSFIMNCNNTAHLNGPNAQRFSCTRLNLHNSQVVHPRLAHICRPLEATLPRLVATPMVEGMVEPVVEQLMLAGYTNVVRLYSY